MGKPPVSVPPRFITLQIGLMQKIYDLQKTEFAEKTDLAGPGDRPTKIKGQGTPKGAPSPEGPPVPSTKGAAKVRVRMRTTKKLCF